jgi:hypothetical protein
LFQPEEFDCYIHWMPTKESEDFKSMEFIGTFPGSIILLCPYASNVIKDIDHNIKQGLNIDAILFAKKTYSLSALTKASIFETSRFLKFITGK